MAKIARKSLALTFDAEQEGAFKARIATLAPVVDREGDVTLPGAFPEGKRVLIGAYEHGSVLAGALPVGEGVISSDEKAAYVTGRFFLDTQIGAETYKTVKNAGDLQEYSYGYKVKAGSMNPVDLKAYPGASRILKSLDIFEIAPVFIGAGQGTGTMTIKSVSKARALVAKLKAAGEFDSGTVALIAQIDALTDELDDTVDALMAGLGIPDPDEDGSGGGDSADLSAEEPVEDGMEPILKGVSFVDHSKRVLADAQAFVSRAKSLADLRAKKSHKAGRVLSTVNVSRLTALHDGLSASVADLRDLLDSTNSTEAGGQLDPEGGEAKAINDNDLFLMAVRLDMDRRAALLSV